MATAIAVLSCIAFQKSAIAQQCNVPFAPGSILTAGVGAYPGPVGVYNTDDTLPAIQSTFAVVVGAGNPIPANTYVGWCVDAATDTPANFALGGLNSYAGPLYATCDPNLNSSAELGQYNTPTCVHPNTEVSSQVWLEVDYILNYYNTTPTNKYTAPGYSAFWTVQAAINTLVGSASNSYSSYCGYVLTTPTPICGAYPQYDPNGVASIVSAAQNAVAAGWMPSCGEVVGVVYVNATYPCSQFVLIAVPYNTPPTISVTGTNYACLGSNGIPTDISVINGVTVMPGCCPTLGKPTATHVDSSSGCFWTRTFTITVSGCSETITTNVQYAWINDATPPVITKVPAGGFEGCGLTNVPTLANLQSMIGSGITATAYCGTPDNISISEVGSDTTNGCTAERIFTINAYDNCGHMTTTNLIYTYTIQTNINTTTITTNVTTTITVTTNNCTNTVCGNLNCQNTYGCQWVWLNSHISCNPGQPCTVYCKNATITITCAHGKTYTYSCPDGQITFSSSCKSGSSSFDGTKWNTTLPCAGDSEIFLQGCAIPWNSDFANCQNVCWSGVFSCSNPQINCTLDWGNSCYNSQLPTCSSISPKPCYQTSCQNGSYNNDGNHAGCPENYQQSCVSGNGWNWNWNCSWNGSPICCGNLITNITYVTNYTTNVTTTTQCCSTTPPCTTKSICQGFNSQNPSGGWLWCNANINCQPNTQCTVYCQNATITVACNDGNTYTYPVPDCQVNFSPKCNQASCSYNNGTWTTTVPTCGDDQIFLSGCGIPWKSEFANCKNVTWSGTFCCSTPGVACNWQWSSSCYNYNLSNCSSANIKPCHTLSCSYNNTDPCGTPESCKNYCWGGGCGNGGSNWTGSWSSKGSCW
jgi:hypothetical protein